MKWKPNWIPRCTSCSMSSTRLEPSKTFVSERVRRIIIIIMTRRLGDIYVDNL